MLSVVKVKKVSILFLTIIFSLTFISAGLAEKKPEHGDIQYMCWDEPDHGESCGRKMYKCHVEPDTDGEVICRWGSVPDEEPQDN